MVLFTVLISPIKYYLLGWHLDITTSNKKEGTIDIHFVRSSLHQTGAQRTFRESKDTNIEFKVRV